jgi:hypothetical protein
VTPTGIARLGPKVILDEIQHVPELFQSIKLAGFVDRDVLKLDQAPLRQSILWPWCVAESYKSNVPATGMMAFRCGGLLC